MNQLDSSPIRRVEVFSKAQRITHWLITLGILFELISAWLIQHAAVDVLAWIDYHVMVGQALLLPILFRIYLLFRPGSGHWRLLIPTREQRHVLRQTVKFYASLGRLPCPDWYAYNPLWQPLYLLMIPIMLLATLSGFGYGNNLALAGIRVNDLHALLAHVILYFSLLHILFVFLHDARGNGGQISAMVNGHKYFHIKQGNQPGEPNSVAVDSILKKSPRAE